jgi:SAM-dependent methyltransferase
VSTTVRDDKRYEREARFHDHSFAKGKRNPIERFYSITHSSSKAMYREYLKTHCEGRLVLEYGCGADGHSALLSRLGGTVAGIDLSFVAVTLSRDDARRRRDDRSHHCVMNAECLGFADGSFDMVCGMGILHHLDLSCALGEIARVLSPGGTAIFLEPLGHNPAINLYRKLTPDLRTPDEHPLVMADFQQLSKHFGRHDITYFHLTSLAAMPLRRAPGFERLVQKLNRLDQWMFRRFASLRKYAWAAAIILSAPIKGQATPRTTPPAKAQLN